MTREDTEEGREIWKGFKQAGKASNPQHEKEKKVERATREQPIHLIIVFLDLTPERHAVYVGSLYLHNFLNLKVKRLQS